ncbi:hypothetical protein HPB49_011648 [Dermacentor silvarum]|uniref:Uncharacterized protein n=1 Tax=Dermacentor silvarum TaxID=543639 RepID=A0ACB8D5J8_DERSI|nr:hypothetical protein HPB49_011648 [Dermacentor silvarum]
MVGSISGIIRDEVQQALHSHRHPFIPNMHYQRKGMQLKVILVGLAIFGLMVAESGAMPASSASEAEARADPETAERAEQSNAEEARISEACMASLFDKDWFARRIGTYQRASRHQLFWQYYTRKPGSTSGVCHLEKEAQQRDDARRRSPIQKDGDCEAPAEPDRRGTSSKSDAETPGSLTTGDPRLKQSGAMPASSASEAEARADPETVERAEQSNAEEARISEACMASLCG